MTDLISGALLSGVSAVVEYLAAHTVTCLVPAFFIAGAIAAFVKKEAILTYFSPTAKKSVSYGIASISGIVLAVCSCTILPMFAGILKKGSGIGPATFFLIIRLPNQEYWFSILFIRSTNFWKSALWLFHRIGVARIRISVSSTASYTVCISSSPYLRVLWQGWVQYAGFSE